MLDGDPVGTQLAPTAAPRHFRPMPIVAKRSPISATAELLLAHIYCGQTAECIKMPLGTEVNLGPGDVVLDGFPVPPKRNTAPSFWPMSIVAKRLE